MDMDEDLFAGFNIDEMRALEEGDLSLFSNFIDSTAFRVNAMNGGGVKSETLASGTNGSVGGSADPSPISCTTSASSNDFSSVPLGLDDDEMAATAATLTADDCKPCKWACAFQILHSTYTIVFLVNIFMTPTSADYAPTLPASSLVPPAFMLHTAAAANNAPTIASAASTPSTLQRATLHNAATATHTPQVKQPVDELNAPPPLVVCPIEVGKTSITLQKNQVEIRSRVRKLNAIVFAVVRMQRVRQTFQKHLVSQAARRAPQQRATVQMQFLSQGWTAGDFLKSAQTKNTTLKTKSIHFCLFGRDKIENIIVNKRMRII